MRDVGCAAQWWAAGGGARGGGQVTARPACVAGRRTGQCVESDAVGVLCAANRRRRAARAQRSAWAGDGAVRRGSTRTPASWDVAGPPYGSTPAAELVWHHRDDGACLGA